VHANDATSSRSAVFEVRFVNRTINLKEIPMKRTIAMLSLVLALAVTAFAQTAQIKSACAACCQGKCGQTCCQHGCGDCCKGK
jgi:hypothetical protein